MRCFIYNLIGIAIAILLLHACDTDIENEVIQKPFTADEVYYENLRNYKKTDHAVSFGWFAGYSNVDSPSMGNHFVGLPDSMDIISLWMGIPAGELLDEMYQVRKLKGTRFVLCTICHIGNAYSHDDEGLRAFAMSYIDKINEYDLDGLDLDYEPGSDWLKGDNFTKFIKVLGEYLGPQSGSGKLLIIDYAGAGSDPNQFPQAATEPYVDYYVEQTYGQSGSTTGPDFFQNRYDKISIWCPSKKFIVTEQMGWHGSVGGIKFVEKDGNNLDSCGNPLYSMVGMARWNPKQGRKGGFGGFYFEAEYNTTRPANQAIGDKGDQVIPYYSMRRGIQEQNPAVR